MLRIPLLIIDSRVAAPRTVSARVQGQDLFPTLLHLAGQDPELPTNSSAVDLRGLLFASQAELPSGLTESRRLTFQSARMGYQTPRSHDGQLVTGFSDGRRKYIYEQYDTPRRLLFDLRTDPGELNPTTSGPAVDAAHAELLALKAAESS